ncbi:alpha/beta hydrolase [Piscinibacter sakaiensis]|uniref:alpha/beta hydrolase n=1 Tax=Piscinibacter sakaiensis TaxID=1547922 RepID=UPI003AAC8828
MPRCRWLLILLALTAGAAAADAAGEPTPCRLPGVKHQVWCGSVQRPLDPQRPDGPQIEVAYALVPALARRKLPDPVVLLAGGPGQSAMSLAGAVLPLLQRLNNRRDLLFVDQRGTGRSAPLDCDPPPDAGFATPFDAALQQQWLAECRGQLARLPWLGGLDGLRFFTTPIAVADLDAVRRQLGIERVNLIGVSYGSRVALEMLRQFPGSVRRVVLDGVAPPDMALPASMSADNQRALDALFAACERETACSQAHPQLRTDWHALLSRLPLATSLRDPRSGRMQTLQLSREIVLGAVRAALYQPAVAAALPAALGEAAAGRFEPLAALASIVAPDPSRDKRGGLAAGMHFSVVCSEDLPRLPRLPQPDSASAGNDFGNETRQLYQRICADWPRGAIDPAFYRIEPVDTPVLLLSGGLDPATPPRHGERVAARLGAMASHRVIAKAGHGVLAIGCMRNVVYRFIAADDAAAALAVDSGCAESIPRPPVFLPPSPKASQ